MVPENIQTPTTEGIGNSRGGGQRPRKFQKGGGLDHKITFQGVNIISFSTSFSNIASYRPGRSFLGHE